MEANFSVVTLIGLAIASFAGLFSHVIIWIIWRRKTGEGCFPLISGIIAYILISLARVIIRVIFLRGFLANYFTAGLISGVCEEASKYLVFRYLLYDYKNPETSVSYSIGHEGVESISVFSINGLSLPALITGFGYRFMDRDKFLGYLDGTDEEKYAFIASYANIGIGESIMTVISILTGIVFCISLSLLVYMAVHSDYGIKLLIYAAGIHTSVDFINGQFLGPEISPERVITDTILAAGTAYFAYAVYSEILHISNNHVS